MKQQIKKTYEISIEEIMEKFGIKERFEHAYFGDEVTDDEGKKLLIEVNEKINTKRKSSKIY